MKMKLPSLLFLTCFYAAAFGQIPDSTVRDLKAGRVLNDSSHIYSLPYAPGTKYLLVQGWQSHLSHKNEIVQDFKMRIGTPIYAARSGVIIQTKSNGNSAGLKDEFLSEGNNIVIEHEDSTFAGYWHLDSAGVYVNEGDTVKVGQLIGRSGHTGYSAFPHLHFMVWKYEGFTRKTIPIRYYTKKGVLYLRPGKKYKAI